ncbi:hypothetical protein [Lysobacter gummosus]
MTSSIDCSASANRSIRRATSPGVRSGCSLAVLILYWSDDVMS